MSCSQVLSCELAGLQLRLYFITSMNLLPIAFYYNLNLRTPLDLNLSTRLGMKSGPLEEILGYMFLLLTSEAKYLSQGSGAGGWG